MNEILTKIVELYTSNKDSEKAIRMAAYMKNKFPFLGIPSPVRAEINKEIFIDLKGEDIAYIESLVNKLWQMPEREYQYLAISILDKHKNKLTPSHIEFVLELIESKSWWDTIDALVPNYIGYILFNYPELRNEYITAWIESDNIWLNRTAILFQLKYKEDTDFTLQKKIVDSLKHKTEFFVKKAIGWSLREYSKKEAKLVEDYIKKANLQPLSEKEGMKFILNIHRI